MARGPWIDHFGDNFLWSNATLIIKGMAPYGVVALEEMDRACEKLRVRQHEPHAWQEEWGAIGRARRAARRCRRGGRAQGERRRLLSARRQLSLQRRALHPARRGEARGLGWPRLSLLARPGIRLRYPSIEFVEVPYQGITLPALFVKGAGVTGPAPTVVIVDGMDNAKEMSIFFAGLEFARRGFNTLAHRRARPGRKPARARHPCPLRLRGAGRGRLRLPDDAAARSIRSASPSWATASAAITRRRIAAREHRYAAGIALSALHWDLAGWQTRIKEKNKTAPTTVAQSNFQFQWVVNAATPDEAIEIARSFTLKDVAKDIACPVPHHPRRQRPRGAGRERAEALRGGRLRRTRR